MCYFYAPPLRLSVVIVNYNVKHFLEQCLYSVIRATRNLQAEIFVVDNNSVDGSVALIREKFPSVKLLANNENVGFSKANNQAIRLASGQFVLLLNPDTVVQEDTFEKCLAFMDAHPDAGALGIRMLDGKGNFLPESKRGLPTPGVAFYKIFGLARLFPRSKRFGQYHLTYLDAGETHAVDVLSGAYMLIRKEALDKVGLLDETFFMYGEDIDLSYRITQAGYRNYYFAGSSIIHYKGESTRKSSVNYVLVFYRAMAIFARKHFSTRNARAFNALIHLAIYLRAGAAIVARLVNQLFFPAIDFALILAGLYLCKDVYELKFKLYPNFYSAEILRLFFPLYTITWMTFVYFSGGYDRPVSLRRIGRGMLAGTLFILVIYSLLDEHYRFSRALILIGSFYTLGVYLLTRVVYNAAGIKRFRLGGHGAGARIGVVGSAAEFNRVNALLQQTRLKYEFAGHITPSREEPGAGDPLGDLSQVNEIIDVHRITEIIFCARDIPSAQIIGSMMALVTKGIDFRIAPPESLSIIGSTSIDTAGELYVIDVNNVGRPENRRAKRVFDVVSALLILFFSWVLVWFQRNKTGFLPNTLKVLAGIYSWVGYGLDARKDLPALRPSVLSPADQLDKNAHPEKAQLALFNYAKDYKTENDLRILLSRWRDLGG